MSELTDRAKESLHLWDGADVEMFVRYGYNEAETAYRQAPELVTQLVAEVEQLEAGLAEERESHMETAAILRRARNRLRGVDE
ncbi:hypothetical protein [Mycobacteroides chelonae]|uniref:hypothetical protein n=1 Tax=Mycobacteroides chelonae TaxID=1774 RepID=UPI0008A9242D|nr:hypothetical protein [Mycobacteroides chelonae]OHU64046.1 hypothetical protein BKG85_11500 [Mycobacteroides chelonae]